LRQATEENKQRMIYPFAEILAAWQRCILILKYLEISPEWNLEDGEGTVRE
jgi:hypothetical protein